MSTLYQCGGCGGVTNTTWSWGGKQLCRVCFGRERLGDFGTGGVQHATTVKFIRSDGTSVEIDPTRGVPLESSTKAAIQSGDASTRKIRIVETKK